MALQIINVVLFTVFFSEALTLLCYNCPTPVPPATCAQTANCSSNSQCSSITTYDGSKIVDVKKCADSACANWTINLGSIRVSSKCCSSDLCNNATASDSENGKMCYTCSDTNCSNTQTLRCKGDENQCFTATAGKNSIVKGCANQIICANKTILNLQLSSGLRLSLDPSMFSVSCCEKSLCNNAQNMAQGPVVLLVPILSLLFSI